MIVMTPFGKDQLMKKINALKGDLDQRRRRTAKTCEEVAKRADRRSQEAEAQGRHKQASWERATAESRRETAKKALNNIGKEKGGL